MKKIALLALALVLSGIGFAQANETTAPATSEQKPALLISGDELNNLITSGEKVVIIDARSEKDFSKAHIKVAISLPADQATPENLSKIIPNKEAKAVFYCSGPECTASNAAAVKAREAGYLNVYRFEGGIKEWSQKKFPTDNKG